jgi:hypothetical protein
LSGSIPELPHVEQPRNRAGKNAIACRPTFRAESELSPSFVALRRIALEPVDERPAGNVNAGTAARLMNWYKSSSSSARVQARQCRMPYQHAGTPKFGELDGKRSNPAGGAVNDDRTS